MWNDNRPKARSPRKKTGNIKSRYAKASPQIPFKTFKEESIRETPMDRAPQDITPPITQALAVTVQAALSWPSH